jgi:hypothetical protein
MKSSTIAIIVIVIAVLIALFFGLIFWKMKDIEKFFGDDSNNTTNTNNTTDSNNTTTVKCVNGTVKDNSCVCGTGYHLVGDTCKLMCLVNEELDSDGDCVCKPGYSKKHSTEGTQCTKCEKNQTLIQGKCVDNCGAHSHHNDDNKCYCDMGYVMNDGVCKPECDSQGKPDGCVKS